ncbi:MULTISPECIES: TIGR02391 family protein [unclassified Acinetobacter]|uniref:TIGR02391 family protein n=1 Tax=unclassified Acinetobacter TaxID=196816 RepID=UPI002577D342|nr:MULTISPECIES: TIGR02391 family protein [unclassified Acinetobacter]MDM1762890.1 TIGR02391 family protein [Acinetobacter sp. 226-1]MDM1766369.1 TIGR02391 family protein [Acinetobacter sp. 226-4]
MAIIKSFDLASLESISKILGETAEGLSGTEITKYLFECSIKDPQLNSTKWKRLYDALYLKQNEDRCANNILAFIQHIMRPSRHVHRKEWFENKRTELNYVLSFEGVQIVESGEIKQAGKVKTFSEAEERAQNLRKVLLDRKIHADVLTFCKAELLVDNYFHAVFEATKSIAEKIRIKTNLTSDGGNLVDEAFSYKGKIPYLALNNLTTESHESEQKGFMNLLKGVFGTFRNTTAHAPKITWEINELDALDILSMISLIHRKLDKAVEAKKMYEGQI